MPRRAGTRLGKPVPLNVLLHPNSSAAGGAITKDDISRFCESIVSTSFVLGREEARLLDFIVQRGRPVRASELVSLPKRPLKNNNSDAEGLKLWLQKIKTGIEGIRIAWGEEYLEIKLKITEIEGEEAYNIVVEQLPKEQGPTPGPRKPSVRKPLNRGYNGPRVFLCIHQVTRN